MLDSLAAGVAGSARRRHLLFLGATVFTVLFVGYHFGTFDQTIHIPFLKKYADPTLYPGDPFFDLRFQHYSFFWLLFVPVYRAGVLEVTMLVVHVLVTYLTFWMAWELSLELFQSPLAALLSTVALVFPHLGFAGFPIIEFSLLNRTFVLPFLLLAMQLYLRRRFWAAYALLGVMYNLHVISVQFVLAMFLLDGVWGLRRVGWRNVAVGLLLFLAAASPVLAWKLSGSPVDFTPRPEWFHIVARGMLYNLFYLLPPYLPILVITFAGVSALLLFVIAQRRGPSGPHDGTVAHFMAAAVLILVAQVVTAQWLPVTIIIQSQIIRAGLFVLIFAYLYFGRYVARRYCEAPQDRAGFAMLAGSYVFFTLPVAPLFVWVLERIIRPAVWRRVLTGLVLAALMIGSVGLALRLNVWSPGIHAFGPRTAWEEAQFWARDHTPRDALFITPPQVFWMYQSDWRVFSERSTVATQSELLEAAFAPDYLAYWQPRFEAVAPGALARFRGDYFENKAIIAEAFYSLTTADFQRVAQRFGASYLVVEKPHAYGFPVVHENEGYRVYEIR